MSYLTSIPIELLDLIFLKLNYGDLKNINYYREYDQVFTLLFWDKYFKRHEIHMFREINGFKEGINEIEYINKVHTITRDQMSMEYLSFDFYLIYGLKGITKGYDETYELKYRNLKECAELLRLPQYSLILDSKIGWNVIMISVDYEEIFDVLIEIFYHTLNKK